MGQSAVLIAVVAALVIAAAYYFAAYRPRHKEGYHNNWGFKATRPVLGCANHASQNIARTCSALCHQAPHGLTHTDCMYACTSGEMDKIPGHSACASGAC